ncbi:uncharacterized protein HMPREF1541_02637 [Cyphellophora europaea CBS 101466]|uniref:PH domain-containing protein n=1 Tax=Cyphellophora europaea (strain CBS 101466) TaxID=1220924 RepID=W2S622_CYPE1|nr:uncharacterized protein HMPREF1541_02637 [Cyphellophora europaea CBS 101466]ETN43478.1 hypothetical protein HMPREF1541_02637 [Cyphellophora europaea CBS 101466]
MASQMSWDHQHLASPHVPSPSPSPSGSLKGLLSRTLSRGRATQPVHPRKPKSRPSSPKSPDCLREPASTTATTRARSTTWSGHSRNKSHKASKCSPGRASSAKNPPPFAEAFRHAILHAKLETPVATGTSKASKGAALSPALAVDVVASPRQGVGRGSRSNSASHTLVTKLFILTDDACILQYLCDGPSNRTPEKVLELGPQSISVASDAIVGKHWVLNVVYNGSDASAPSNESLKPSRPRLFSRLSSEAKKQTREMLLVFENDCKFNQWLICVRKEIEALGGLEYRPDSRGVVSMLETTPAATNDIGSGHCRSAPFIPPAAVTPSSRDYHASDDVTMSPQSTTRSSVGTTTDLDRLRDSCLLDNRSFNSGTGSSYADSIQEQIIPDINIVLTDATQFEAPNAASPAGRRKKPQPIIVLPRPRRRSASCSPGLASPSFPRTPTLATDAVHTMAGAFDKPASPVTPVSPGRHDLTPFSFMEKFQFTPYTGAERLPFSSSSSTSRSTSMERTLREFDQRSTPALQYQAEFDRFAGDTDMAPHERPERPSLSRLPSAAPPPYSLAPQRKSSLIFRDKSVSRARSVGNLMGLGISGQTGTDLTARATNGHRDFSTSAETVTLLGSDAGNPTTSKSVKEEANSCFGGEGSMVTGESLALGLDADAEVSNESKGLPAESTEGLTQQRRANQCPEMSRQKSMPNLICRSQPPIAPPPSGPLPAIPSQTSASRQNQRGRSVSPPLETTSHGFGPRHLRSTTMDSPRAQRISPLSSNPVSPAEIKFAHRLSTVNGFAPVAANPSLSATEMPRERKASITKGPPPSTWEIWKKSPKIASAPSSRRSSLWTTTPPVAQKAAPVPSIDALLQKPLPVESDHIAHDSAEETREASTIEINGFKFPVAI